MIWLVFALASAVAIAGYRISTRHIMKSHSPWAYALMVNVIGAAYTLPFVFADWHLDMPRTLWPWLLVLFAACLWTIIMVLAFTTMKLLPVTRREQISQVEVLFVLCFGLLFLHEQMTWTKGIGVALVIAGALVAALGRTPIYNGWKSKGVGLTVLVAALYGLAAIVDKTALQYWPTGMYTFLEYLLPGAILAFGLTRRRAWFETKHLISHRGWVLLAATAMSVTGYYFGLRAYDLADASVVYTVLKMATIFAVIGGLIVFREERVHLKRKIISAIMVVLGAVIIAGGALFI